MCFSMWTMCLCGSKKNNHGGTENTEISVNSKIPKFQTTSAALCFFPAYSAVILLLTLLHINVHQCYRSVRISRKTYDPMWFKKTVSPSI